MTTFNDRVLVLVAGTLFATAGCGGNGAVPAGAGSSGATSAAARIAAPVDTTSILKKLTQDVVIGSTVDPNNGDKGPRTVALVQSTFGLTKGQLLVCNFADSTGAAGKGSTIEVLDPKPNSKPVTFKQSPKLLGCDGDAVTEANQVFAAGMLSGLLSWFDSDGSFKKSFSSYIKAPFSVADAFCGLPYAPEDVYVSDSKNGTLVKLSFVSVSGRTKVTQVVSGFAVNDGTGWSVLGPSGIQYNNKRTGSLCNDTLYVVDGANNTVVSISTASSLLQKNEIVVQPGGKTFKCAHPAQTCATLVHSGPPLNAPVASALLPNGNLVVANTKGGNKLVEMTPTGRVLATKLLDHSKTAHVFGLVAGGTTDTDTVLFYTDTQTNTLHELQQ